MDQSSYLQFLKKRKKPNFRAGVVKTGELKEPVALVKTGAVRVLLVSVSVPVNVTRFVGVIMSDKFAMCYASGLVGQSPVSRSGKSA